MTHTKQRLIWCNKGCRIFLASQSVVVLFQSCLRIKPLPASDIVTKHLEITECWVILLEVNGYGKAGIQNLTIKNVMGLHLYSRSLKLVHLVQLWVYTHWTTSHMSLLLSPGNHHSIVQLLYLWLFQMPHIWRIMQLSFWGWQFISLSNMSSGPIHIVSMVGFSFFFFKTIIFHCTYASCFIYLFICR